MSKQSYSNTPTNYFNAIEQAIKQAYLNFQADHLSTRSSTAQA